MPLRKLPFGNYLFKIKVLSNKKVAAARQMHFRFVETRKKGNFVRTDRFRRVLVVNGKPFAGLSGSVNLKSLKLGGMKTLDAFINEVKKTKS